MSQQNKKRSINSVFFFYQEMSKRVWPHAKQFIPQITKFFKKNGIGIILQYVCITVYYFG